MQEFFGSVRRSLVLRASTSSPSQSPTTDDNTNNNTFGGIVDKIGTSIRRSRIGLFSSKSPPPPPLIRALPPSTSSPLSKENMPPLDNPTVTHPHPHPHPIRWRKGEIIGSGAFGRVFMGMNLDSGELIAVKQVLIASSGCASKEQTQNHIRELEEEVKLLKNLSHPNIVRYLGTAREDEALNIFLEFVPGGSIASLLGKFGSFPESVLRMYTKQLLVGLEYLHKNGIMHRDIKGANILVDNKGCIKLADFGASKKVVELATMTGAKSMKGTTYWMAPEVILQTGHSFSADIWSVGCTVIEMATGKPPWCQLQEVAALFHIGSTQSPPPTPEHLSEEAKDFLLKCLQKDKDLRASASELLQHPFVTSEYQEPQSVFRRSAMGHVQSQIITPPTEQKSISNVMRTISGGLKDVCNMGSLRCSTVCPDNFSGTGQFWGMDNGDDDMCLIDDKIDFSLGAPDHLKAVEVGDDFNKSFNPMSEPNDDWSCKFDDSPEIRASDANVFQGEGNTGTGKESCNGETEFTFPSEPSGDDDDEVTESKIRAFLDEKALDLKKLQEEFYSTLNAASPKAFGGFEGNTAFSNMPPKSKSPSRLLSRRLSSAADVCKSTSPSSHSKLVSDSCGPSEQPLPEVPEEGFSSSPSFSERERLWKEELVKELEMERERLAERMRQVGGKTSSPIKRVASQQRERLPFPSPTK